MAGGQKKKPVTDRMRMLSNDLEDNILATDRFHTLHDIMASRDWPESIQLILEEWAMDEFFSNKIEEKTTGYYVFDEFYKNINSAPNSFLIKPEHKIIIKEIRDSYVKEVLSDVREIDFISNQIRSSLNKVRKKHSYRFLEKEEEFEDIVHNCVDKIVSSAETSPANKKKGKKANGYDLTLPKLTKRAWIKKVVVSVVNDYIDKFRREKRKRVQVQDDFVGLVKLLGVKYSKDEEAEKLYFTSSEIKWLKDQEEKNEKRRKARNKTKK